MHSEINYRLAGKGLQPIRAWLVKRCYSSWIQPDNETADDSRFVRKQRIGRAQWRNIFYQAARLRIVSGDSSLNDHLQVVKTRPSRLEREGECLHCGAEMIAQHIKQLYLRRTVHADGNPVALSDAHGHHFYGTGQVCPAGAHFQGADGVGIGLCQFCQTAGRTQQHGKIVLQCIAERFDGITP